MKINPLVQLEELLAEYSSVTIERTRFGVPAEYEVTVYRGHGIDHSHYGGDTLAEAINRAMKGNDK